LDISRHAMRGGIERAGTTGETGADDPVRRVDDLGELQAGRDTREHVGVDRADPVWDAVPGWTA
jgi:hypothetical protein